MKVVTKDLLRQVVNLYETSINHCKWREKRYADPRQLVGLKAAAYDKLIEHLNVILDGDFEDVDSLP